MEPVRLTVPGEDGGVRLDSFLAASLPELTRSAAARLIETGQVTVEYFFTSIQAMPAISAAVSTVSTQVWPATWRAGRCR